MKPDEVLVLAAIFDKSDDNSESKVDSDKVDFEESIDGPNQNQNSKWN